MRKVVVSLLVISFVFGGVYTLAQADDLKFTIKLDKETYKLGEPVYCKMYLKNLSQKDVIANTRFSVNYGPDSEHEVYFKIIDASGNPIKFIPVVTIGPPERKWFKTLKQGDYVQYKYELSNNFAFKNASEYAFLAVYENHFEPEGISVWTGSIESNVVLFEIK